MSLADCLRKLPQFSAADRKDIINGGGLRYVKLRMDQAIRARNALRGALDSQDSQDSQDALVERPQFSTVRFFSQLTTQIDKVPDRLATQPASQWKLWIASNAAKLGIKKDEILWSGLDNYLDLRGKEKVSREEIAQFLSENGTKVQDVILGAKDPAVEARHKRAEEAEKIALWEMSRLTQDVGRLDSANLPWWAVEEAQGDKFSAEKIDGLGLSAEARDAVREYGGARVATAATYEAKTADIGSATKFAQYVVPGGENYRELLITLPEVKTRKTFEQWTKENFDGSDTPRTRELYSEQQEPGRNFQSTHFDQPNILAHLRMDERTDADGSKVLFLQELQSDWGQSGKKKGFDPAEKVEGLTATGIPLAPFVTDTKSWVALGLKRAIMYAVQHGMSKVAWANGEQNAGHYDLSKQISAIRYNKIGGEYGIVAMGHTDSRNTGIVMERTVPESGLEEIVGKELAQKIINGEGTPGKTELNNGDVINTKSFSGLDLKVGGEGMKAFYDQILPQVANDVLKKLGGGRVEAVEFVRPNASRRDEILAEIEAEEGGQRPRTPRLQQQGFTITPAMAEKVQTEGMPQFSRQRGRENIDTANRRIGKFVDAFVAGQVKAEDTQLLGPTPVVLRAIGAPDLQMEIDGAVLEKVLAGKHRHDIAPEVLKQLPEGLYDPLMVFKQPDGGALMLTELTAETGNPIVTAVHFQVKSGRMLVNRIATAFEYDNLISRFSKNLENLRYVRNEKDLATSTKPGQLVLPDLVQKARSLGANILTEDDLVNMYGPKFSRARSAITNQQIQQAWKAPDNLGKWDDFVRKMQDKLVDTKRVVAAVREAGIAIKDSIDPYLQEILYHGRAAKRVSDFADNELRPLLVEMQARGIERQEVEDYLWARHATERNAQIAKVNPAMPDSGSGLSNQEAADILAGRQVTIGGREIKLVASRMAAYQSLAKRVDAITKETTDTLVRYGLETQATVDAWRATYGNYVPLMRDMESDDNYAGAFNLGLGTGQGFSVRGSAAKRAMGSERGVVDILANVAMQRERAIVRGEKNRVSQALYGLVVTAPNPDFWLALNPDAGKKPADVIAELVRLGLNPLDAENIAKEPKQQYIDPRTGMVMERINPQLRSRGDVLAVRIDGKDRYVMFSSDERAQQMVRNLKNLDAEQLGAVAQNVAVVTRWFASINTQYNPVFGLTNGIRDLGTAALNLSSTDLKGDRAAVLAGAFSALKGVYSDLRDHRAGRTPTSQWALLYEEFADEGGQTGYRDMFQTSQARTEDIAKELKAAGKGQRWLALGEKNSHLFGWLSDYNTSIENAVRLSAYKVAKDKGMSKQQAAALAKGLTVNFNKKGEAATQVGAMYAFFNAAVQGTARIGETMVRIENGKPSLTTAGKTILYGGMMAGVMQGVLFALAGYDDEEPPQFSREKNFIIPDLVFGSGKYVSVPYPLGFHVIPGIGRIATEFALGGFKNPGKRMVDLVSMIMDGFNPIGGSSGGLTQMLSPTVIDPVVALNENKDWTGKQIFKEDFNKMHPTPGWTRKKDTASDIARWLSYGINYVTGGGQYEIGILSPTPDQIDYLIGQGTGGVGREGLKVWQFGSTAASGEDMPMYKIPIAGRFIGETTGQASEVSKFYNNLKRIGEHKSALDEMKEARDKPAELRYKLDNPDARMVQQADKAAREIGFLKRQKREMIEKDATKEQVKLQEAKITAKVRQWNAKLSDTR